ncbi:MAG: ABC transporter substrate-binding protein [Muribaculaceae bacterium]|nr:ABC transporter substrate-binding protein [Muribaculaceae bacterium]
MEKLKAVSAVLITIILCTVLQSCGARGGNDAASHLQSTDSILYQPKYAGGFTIKGIPGKKSTLIEVKNPWQGAENVSKTILVLRDHEEIPADFDGQVVKANAASIVCMSSTHVALLDANNNADKVTGVSGRDFISNSTVRARGENVAEIGFDSNIDYEALAALHPDIVLLYGVNSASAMESKLNELNIPYMYVGDYLEQSPLGKAEWMVALAELTGDRQKAEEAYASIPERYNKIVGRVKESGVADTKVMLNTPYADSWVMPSADNYVVRLINDAGGKYLYDSNSTGSSKPVDREEALLMASEADVWINTGMINSLADLKKACKGFDKTKIVTEGKVYNNTLRTNPNGGNDYWESGVVNPDLILSDLVNILHPGLLDDAELHYYKKLD